MEKTIEASATMPQTNTSVSTATKAAMRSIRKVAVLGSGVMGSRIACHFANIGVQVLLLDIVPRQLTDKEEAKGLSLESPQVRNRLVNDALAFALKSKPSPIYDKAFASRITTGNMEDDMKKIAECDWIIEVVVERLDIKQKVYEQVEKYRKKGTLITSNTSGIPIHLLVEGRSQDFAAHFCGTHFFNPPRYLQLLEIIPSPQTKPEVVDFLMAYGDLFLGKTTVLTKDTPAFIANRIGVFSILAIFKVMEEMDMNIEEVDALTGPITGRPKSATFRTSDVVGLDTLVKVAKGVKDNAPNDEAKDIFTIPSYLETMVENKWLGDKTGQGFYKKTKDEKGKRQILALNLKTLEYAPKEKIRMGSIGAAKPIDNLAKRLKTLHNFGDKGSKFLNQVAFHLFRYVTNRFPETVEHVYKVDDALRAGFGWKMGPFEYWDALGVTDFIEKMEEAGFKPAQWVYDMLDKGITSFYKAEDGQRKVYSPNEGKYVVVPGTEDVVILDNYRNQEPVYKNSGCTVHDIGDGVLCIEFQTKMNAIGAEIIEGINKAIDIAEKSTDWKGIVIGNDADNFSAGANLAMILMLAIEHEMEELDFAIRAFQNTSMRIKTCSVPVVVAPHGLTLGGGCEFTMHSDKAVASAETYIGLVEVGAGVIPGGGGTKELALRAAETYTKENIKIPTLQEKLMQIATAKVATSAHEALNMGILRKGVDQIVVNPKRVLSEAKQAVIELFENGYQAPAPREDVIVLGRTALGTFAAGIVALQYGRYASEHDAIIANKVAHVICGGDLSYEQKVSEQYLLDLERQAFLELLMTEKSLKRIESILKTGKPLRN